MPQTTRSFSTPLSGFIAGALLAASISMPALAQDAGNAGDEQQRQQSKPLSLKIQQDRDIRAPRRGEAMDSVERRFGEPRKVRGPVGDPPITRWQYAEFEVVFEDETVIHTVMDPDTNG